MQINRYRYPESSFLSVDKDMDIILGWMLKDTNLEKLLYYTTKDALKKPNLTEEQTVELVNTNIKRIPKLYIDGTVLNYVIISFDKFTPSSNPQFRDNIITFDIICHFDQWELLDNQLRPYRIAAQIDTLFNNRHLTGIGVTNFLGASQIVLNDEFAGLSLVYEAVHGGEDKYGMPNPADQQQFVEDFNQLFNPEEFPESGT